MADAPPPGDRIAKVLARAGVASRREAERMIAVGLVSVNGRVIDSPALNVTGKDKVLVDGKPLPETEGPRLWRYHKPQGLVTTTSDERGRDTVFDALPDDLPRVLSVGRLDLNSEGLLLLTNDGEIKRKLELPSTGWSRKYRVRVNGRPKDESFAPLRAGLVDEGERFQPMVVELDRQQGANAWLTVTLREGKNREIRRAMEAIGLRVNRLIRVGYGPFQLGDLKAGEVNEVRPRVMADQLGIEMPKPRTGPKPKPAAKGKGKPAPGSKPDHRSKSAPRAKPASAAHAKPKPAPKPRSKPPSKSPSKSPSRSGPKPGAARAGKTRR
jgi:23S rRNA pseudouridine2605 synthase